MDLPNTDIPLLLRLPNELLYQIGRDLQVVQNGQVVDCYDLAAFSLTCRRIHLAAAGALYSSAPIASETQLESLGAVRGELLVHLRCVVRALRWLTFDRYP